MLSPKLGYSWCTVCRAALKIHKNRHTGVKPFTCPQCPASFSSKGSLERHMAGLHSQVAPFKCDTCGKAFKVKDSLRKHLRLHAAPEYVCKVNSICCVAIKNKYSLFHYWYMSQYKKKHAFVTFVNFWEKIAEKMNKYMLSIMIKNFDSQFSNICGLLFPQFIHCW